MSPHRWRKLAGLLLATAWAPIVVSCEPTGWDGVVRVAGHGWPFTWITEHVYEEWYDDGDCCGYADGWGGDFWFYYDD